MAGFDAYAVSLLHMDGSDESTTFTDENGRTWTAHGNAQIDTAQKVFGTGSGQFDRVTDTNITTPQSNDFDIRTGDFCIDYRVRFGGGGTYTILDLQDNITGMRIRNRSYPGDCNITPVLVGNSYAWEDMTLTYNTWYHIALTRDGTDLRLFIDGTQYGETKTSSDDIRGNASGIIVGTEDDGGTAFDGWIDELRISVGVSRWTSNFTPPTKAYNDHSEIEADLSVPITLSSTLQTWGLSAGLTVPVNLSSTLTAPIVIDASLPIPVSIGGTINHSYMDATLPIPVSIGGTVHFATREFDATIEIPVNVSGTMFAHRVLEGTLSVPVSVGGTLTRHPTIQASLPIPITMSGTMSEIDKRLTANLAIPISVGGTIEVYPLETLVLVKDIPALEITAEGYDSCIGVFVQDLPSLGITASGYASVIANALATLPCLSISAEGSSTIIGTLSRTLPGLGLSATGLLGSIGTLSVSLPSLKISATSYSSVIGTANITLPSLILSTSVTQLEYLSMVMNLRNQALTEFTNYEFNSMCHYKGLNLGATKTGINLLDTGDTDNDTAIDWNFRTGLLDLHMKTKKKLRQAWLSCKINGDLTVTVIEASGDEYEYDAESYEITEDGVRVKFGRGLKSRYLALDVKNDEEATIVLDSIRLNLDRTEKRR